MLRSLGKFTLRYVMAPSFFLWKQAAEADTTRPADGTGVGFSLFTISTATRGDPDAAPHRDKADYVYRTC
jgi:hypothetical protein